MNDAFRQIYPHSKQFSRYYVWKGKEGATRIDRCYKWGNIQVIDAEYMAVSFSDHLAHVVTFKAPTIQNLSKQRRKSTLVFGEAKTGKDDAVKLLAADANLVASGVSKDATCDQLAEFLESKGVKVTEIELISNAPERRTNTFRVAIKAADYEKALQPEVWPYRVGVRRYIPKRPKNDWASQSSNSGGNIQLESAVRHGDVYTSKLEWQGGGEDVFNILDVAY